MVTETISRQNQLEKIDAFRRLHIPGNPIVLYNIWDAGSAQAVANQEHKQSQPVAGRSQRLMASRMVNSFPTSSLFKTCERSLGRLSSQ